MLVGHRCVTPKSTARHEAETCGGPAPDHDSVPRTLGATLLHAELDLTADRLNVSMLGLIEPVPAGVSWAGWTPALPDDGTAATLIDRPGEAPREVKTGTEFDLPGGPDNGGDCCPSCLPWIKPGHFATEGVSGAPIFDDEHRVRMVATTLNGSRAVTLVAELGDVTIGVAQSFCPR